ncbi:MAG: Stk1 family PASTA domain-containing Ser/Thr kinase [Actinomycetia bacterium]|nr:Stk1 family PASTA domain-containing Ser/Thr kinase [Actinomycetes bacterium]MCH9800970.1 Stk1 family PASTA domain-containing Ser/Thr kinase [Actinomycetes bacterium]
METMVADTLVGRTVDGRYRVESRIAVGGMATVYRALDLRLDRLVAMKVMHERWAEDPDFLARFHAEAKAAARLSQPNVVGVYDQGEWDGLVYLIMEYVPGRTLRAVLRETGAIQPALALTLLDQVLQALDSSHGAGFVHRDIKPENILITPDGAVKVTDFGLARALRAPSNRTSGALIGTAAYLSPEQVSGQPTDERSDIYQAGILLFELLTGEPPFSGETSWDVASQHVNTAVPPVTELNPDCPPGLAELVMLATKRDPSQRLATVGEFRARAAALLADLPAAGPLTTAGSDVTTADQPYPSQDDEATTTAAAPAAAGRNNDGSATDWGRKIGIVAVILLLVAGLAAFLWFNPLARAEVPNVSGDKPEKAIEKLTTAGFVAIVGERAFSEDVAADRVIRTDPEAGASAREGSEVGLVVSLGPERYAVPNVSGERPEEAIEIMAATNLQVVGERKKFDDDIDKGLVIGTDPKTGTKAKRDAPITLLVSKGPAPVQVPSLGGMSEESARDQLSDLGLSPRITMQESETVPEGKVIQTVPASGAKVYRGDSVEVIVSDGPPPVEVPNVIDLPRAEAVAILEAAGFKVKISEGVVTPLDRVYETDPDPGTDAPAGSTITVSIF